MINYNEIFNKIVEQTTKKSAGSNANKDYLKSDIIGNTIHGRFVPNLKNIEQSMFMYYHHGWKSKLDDSGLFFLCPNTYGEKCPICAKSSEMWKSNDPVKKELSKGIRRRQNWLANFFVTSNPKNPDDNGKLKIFRYGKQINDKIKSAISGDDVKYYGQRIFRLDEQGCDFRIKCEQNSESKEAWPTYNNSAFTPQGAIEGITMTPEKIEEILNNVFDLSKMFTSVSAKELTVAMDKHYFSNDISSVPSIASESVGKPTSEKAPTSAPKQERVEDTADASDATVDALLKDLTAGQ